MSYREHSHAADQETDGSLLAAHLVIEHDFDVQIVAMLSERGPDVRHAHTRAHAIEAQLARLTDGTASSHTDKLAAELKMLNHDAAIEAQDAARDGAPRDPDFVFRRIADELLYGNGIFRAVRRR